MPSAYRRQFFDGVKEHSQIKLRALERYLRPWAAKVGSRPGTKRIWVVDGFAGPGVYGTGEVGSPVLALREAQAIRRLGRDYQLSCFFCDALAANRESLRRVRREFPDGEVQIAGDFWNQVDNVVALVGNDPVLVFIDPFGLSDLKFAPLVALCRRLPRVDLVVNFASPVAARLAPDRPELIDQAVGGPGWRLDSLTQDFADRIRRDAGFLPPAILPVVGTVGGHKYDLVMASRHPAAYELWNDEIAREDAAVLNGDDVGERTNRVAECVEFLTEHLRDLHSFQRDRLIETMSVEHCGEFRRGVYIRAVNELVRSGHWTKLPGKIGEARIERTS